MAKISAGLLMYRRHGDKWQVLLVHPGGPFWVKKDAGAWSIPKGECAEAEDPLAAARREFSEETGVIAEGDFAALGEIQQKSGKVVRAWAFEGDLDVASIVSNRVRMEWPRRSGRIHEFPEVDRGAWFTFEEAREKVLAGQLPLLNRLEAMLPATVE